ncbi:bifunctional lysylphosphatidylglycerol flippase/synthetase MprF [Rhizobium sp. 9140]|uniref:bifunctional lysylphosphatidylglycerol flippase/synthetase MprF n=1 Tax=Rhizobium sp. 9140 TaxID=1761900 RepID=UPI000795A0C5|nr:bifunctional lysylphosphatidylglycerol flippase/synthetase MprF [Rhizobium sp. 9140]CZT33324.1 phosphatidylglycerol lysyltransferase [Rhizobium sp. 9140]
MTLPDTTPSTSASADAPATGVEPDGPRDILARFGGISRFAAGGAILLVAAIVVIAIVHLTSEVRYEDVMGALDSTSWTAIALALVFTGLSFFALTFYDVSALSYVKHRLPYNDVALTAFAAYAVGNTAGFGPLSGGAIRYRAYSRLGLKPEEIGGVIAFVTLAFGLGLAAVGSLSLLAIAPEVAPLTWLSASGLRIVAILVLTAIVALMVAGRDGQPLVFSRISVRLPDSRTASRQFLVTVLDLAASASVLYVLLPEGTIGWPAFLAIYSVAVGLGVLSHVPAGLGVFETVIVAALGQTASVDTVLGALVLYRLIYHVVPLILAVLFVVVAEVRTLARKPVGSSLRRVAGRLTPLLLSALALVLAAMLVFSSVTPTPDENLAFLSDYVPLPVIEGAHFLASVLGLALLIAARGLARRLDGAWWAALGLALAALLLSLVKAVALFEAGLLAFFIISLLISRRVFTRPATMTSTALTVPWLTAMGALCLFAVAVLLFVYRDVEYSNRLWWEFELSAEAPRGLRAVLGLVLFSGAVAFWSLMRPARGVIETPSPDDLDRAMAIIAQQGMSDANLVLMGDKSLMFSPDDRAFIMYGRQARSWIALFDPVGPRDAWADLIWQFVESARAVGCRPVFYQVSPAGLSYYADAGLRAFRLGEIATMDLTNFTLKGGKWATLRQTVSRGQRDGLEFELIDAADVPSILNELQAVSDTWLAHHEAKEKGFSLGAFSRDYLSRQPVAVLKVEGKIVAFANILVTDTLEEGSVDLMRFSPEAPKGSMDFLFVSVMEHLRDRGFKRFNLGMAPLAGLSERRSSPVWDKVGRTVFEHGERFYNFKGLKAFKTKFHPRWEPRYMAAGGGISPVLALMDATFLIGGGVKGLVKK